MGEFLLALKPHAANDIGPVMFKGVYINLNRNEARRLALEQHLADIGMAARYQRFEAVDGKAVATQHPCNLSPGALGCWLSHLGVLQQHRGSALHLHVIEDDTVLTRDAAKLFDPFLPVADQSLENLGGWDLLYTDVLVDNDPPLYRLLSQKLLEHQKGGVFPLVDLKSIGFACTSSFFVNRKSIGKIFDLLSGKWSTGKPIDLYLRHLIQQGDLRAFLTIPFLSSLSRESLKSDIRGGQDRSRTMAMLYRQGYFKDADYAFLRDEMNAILKDVQVTPIASLYLGWIHFLLSDQHQHF